MCSIRLLREEEKQYEKIWAWLAANRFACFYCNPQVLILMGLFVNKRLMLRFSVYAGIFVYSKQRCSC